MVAIGLPPQVKQLPVFGMPSVLANAWSSLVVKGVIGIAEFELTVLVPLTRIIDCCQSMSSHLNRQTSEGLSLMRRKRSRVDQRRREEKKERVGKKTSDKKKSE